MVIYLDMSITTDDTEDGCPVTLDEERVDVSSSTGSGDRLVVIPAGMNETDAVGVSADDGSIDRVAGLSAEPTTAGLTDVAMGLRAGIIDIVTKSVTD